MWKLAIADADLFTENVAPEDADFCMIIHSFADADAKYHIVFEYFLKILCDFEDSGCWLLHCFAIADISIVL